jgi:nucleotide-binding universal stress UspA family protein
MSATTVSTTIGPVLIAYDGSADARAAIDTAARLLPGATAVVVYARPPLEGLAAHLEGHPVVEALRDLHQDTLDASERIAVEGAAHARAAGLQAEAEVASEVATAAEAIVELADKVDAALIVLGSRGRGGVRSAILGSTSTQVLHHTGRPTLVIPSEHAAARRAHRHAGTDS